jgi:hypothetical protein
VPSADRSVQHVPVEDATLASRNRAAMATRGIRIGELLSLPATLAHLALCHSMGRKVASVKATFVASFARPF